MTAVSMHGVSKAFGPVRAVRGVSLDVAAGEMFGLIGPDGAGKTTSIRLMCGLLRADAGAVRVLGLDPVRQHRALTHQVGYFSQRFSLYGDLSIDENIAFFAEIHGVKDYRDRRNRLLDMMQLTPFRGRLADRLSGGMKQKLALACTLVHEPRVILLDEPTTGVDPVSRREFWRLLSEFLSEGITIVMATPYLDEAERCARVAMVSDGVVLAADTPAQLRASFPGDLVEVLAAPRAAAHRVVAADGAVSGVQAFGERLHGHVPRGEGASAAVRIEASLRAAGVSVASIRPVPASLEDVFIHRVASAPALSEVSS
jgi:ABC-2 type transport system ATP-binding protein